MKLKQLLKESSFGDFQHLSTDDYQQTDGMPRSGVPVSVQHNGNEIVLAFKNTSEDQAKSATERFASSHGIPYSKIVVYQTGDYEDDWVDASIRP